MALALMFMKIIGNPLIELDPTKYVQSWMLHWCHFAMDTYIQREKSGQ
jgi:hypothetical protein